MFISKYFLFECTPHEKACAFKQAFTVIYKIDIFKENYEIKFSRTESQTLPNLKQNTNLIFYFKFPVYTLRILNPSCILGNKIFLLIFEHNELLSTLSAVSIIS